MSDHARLSASAAERFMECPGSVRLSEALAEAGIVEEESEYAAEGTAAHVLAERCLKEGQDTFMYIGEEIYTDGNGVVWEVTSEMCEAVQMYVDYVREMTGEAELIIEQRIEDPELGPDFGGTSDAVAHRIKDGGGFVHVFDYKHGAGIAVDADDNSQLKYYAFGVLRQLEVAREDDTKVGMTIVQPRAFHSDGEIREAWATAGEVIAWGEDELLPAMARVDTEDTPFASGEWCRFCPAKLACPKLRGDYIHLGLAVEAKNTSDAAGKDIFVSYSEEEIATRFEMIGPIQMYIKALKTECQRRAMKGSAPPGTKLIYGKSSRVWKPDAEEKLFEAFGEDAWTDPDLKSPAQIEKLPGGKDLVGELAYKEKGKPRIVSANERGEEYKPEDAGAGFSAIDTSKGAE